MFGPQWFDRVVAAVSAALEPAHCDGSHVFVCAGIVGGQLLGLADLSLDVHQRDISFISISQ